MLDHRTCSDHETKKKLMANHVENHGIAQDHVPIANGKSTCLLGNKTINLRFRETGGNAPKKAKSFLVQATGSHFLQVMATKPEISSEIIGCGSHRCWAGGLLGSRFNFPAMTNGLSSGPE